MQQYFENRKPIKFSEINKETQENLENIILANERIDKEWKSNHYIINHSTFAELGFKESKFFNDDLRFNAFIGCYFKKTKFENINFTGSKFVKCNFDEVVLINCTFDYCTFEDCSIKYEDFVATMSTRANIKRDLCRNLSLECLKLGKEDDFRKYFFSEKEANELYYWKKFWHQSSEEYYNKYNGIDQLSGLWNFLLSKANRLLWGYGEKISRLIFNIVLVLIFYTCGYFYCIDQISEGVNMTWGLAGYMSLSNFFTVSCDYIPDGWAYKILSVSEGGVGIVLMGFFIAALFRYINRRG